MLPFEGIPKEGALQTDRASKGQSSAPSLSSIIDKVRGFSSSISEPHVAVIQEENIPELPPALVKCARIVKVVETGYQKCQLPLSLTTPANVYFECMQDLFNETAKYAPPDIDHTEVIKLIKESYTKDSQYFDMPYPAFIYFLALRIARGRSDEFQTDTMRIDDWIITVGPLKETWNAAVDLTVRKDVICTAMRQDDEALLKEHLPKFQEAWKTFIDQLVKERRENYHCYCPSISLNLYLERLPEYWKLKKRMEWLSRYKDEFPDDHLKVLRYIEHIHIEEETNEETIRCYLYAKKTLEYCSNYLDLMCSIWFREIKLCKDAPSEL